MKSFPTKLKEIILLSVICLAAYNFILFVIAGFDGHGTTFWLSYIFFNLSIVISIVVSLLIKTREIRPADWIFGYPMLKWCFYYIIVEFVVATVMMPMDSLEIKWGVVAAIHIVVLTVFMVLIISCFIGHEHIHEVHTKVANATVFIRLLQTDVEMVAQMAADPQVKQCFSNLAEQVRYSDPMSSPQLYDLEKQISQQVSFASAYISSNDMASAIKCCQNASLMLTERNKKCKALK